MKYWLLLVLFISPVNAQLAFPSAEGYGQDSAGGRGGDVYIVNSLNDSGAGTLRECATASGPRTCIIAVDGDIVLDSEIQIDNPNLTIAGQTAPGQGIQLRHGQNLRGGIFVNANDVVIRHIKIRLGPTAQDSDTGDCINIGGTFLTPERTILDHISCAWATDELITVNVEDKTTVQDSLFYEGLHDSSHSSGKHSKGPNYRGCGFSMIRSLIANNLIRNPNLTCGKFAPDNLRNGGTPSGAMEIRNVLSFNGLDGFFDLWNGRGDNWTNFVGNVAIKGPSTRLNRMMPYGLDARDQTSNYYDGKDPIRVPSGTTDDQHLCLQDNISEGTAGTPEANNQFRAPALHGILNPNDAHLVESTDCVNNPVGDPTDPRGLTGDVLPAVDVEAYITEFAGAIWWNRDSADTRILNELALRQGSIIDHPNDVGGWPVMQTGTMPLDTDQDGMPDSWEDTFGLDKNDASDRNDDLDGDGFTNLEEYLEDAAHEQVGMGNIIVSPPNPPAVNPVVT